MRRCILALIFAGTLAGCSSAAGAPDLLIVTPDPRIHADPAAAQLAALQCNVLPESNAGPDVSNFILEGPCPFVEKAARRCVVKKDDFYVYIGRQLPDGGQLLAEVNVEFYHGPGVYQHHNEVYLQVSRHGIFWDWLEKDVHVTVLDGAKGVDVAAVEVPAQAGTEAKGTETMQGVITCREQS